MTDSILHPYLPGYFEFRQGLGFKDAQDHFQLRIFERYLCKHNVQNISEINSEFILNLALEALKSKSPLTVNRHLKIIENFFRYLHRIDACESNPLSNKLGFRPLYFSPYVFSDGEIDSILKSFASDISQSRHWSRFCTRLARRCAFVIQANCGLRISEVCQLKLKNIHLSEGTILIEQTKFRKDRLIPVPKIVISEIQNYIEIRKNIDKRNLTDFLLLSYWGTLYSRKTLGHWFYLKVKELGIYRAPYLKGNTIFGSPSTHSLRHSFAVRTVRRWQERNIPIDQVSDTLATYMGHSEFQYTQVYLKALSTDPKILIFKPIA